MQLGRPLALGIALLLLVLLLRAAGSSLAVGSMARGIDGLLVPASQQQPASIASPSVTVPIPAAHTGGLPTPMVLGYYYSRPGGQGFLTLEHDAHLLTGIIPDWYTIWGSGAITGQADPSVVNFARSRGLWDFALVQQNQFGGAVLGPLLRDPVASRIAMDNMLALCEANGYDGINLDFEGIPPQDRSQYTTFVRQLANLLHRSGYYLTLSVPAETANEPDNSWTGAYDYRALGRAADLIMVMAYDEHYAGSTAGPIAATSWVESVVHYAVSVIPPQKLVLGVPLYGYDWSTGVAQGLSYQIYRQIAISHGVSPTAPTVSYWQGGVLHIAYYEGLQAFENKVHVAIDYSLRGIALWRLGLEDPKIWNYLAGS